MERVQEGEIWAGRKVVSRLVDELTSNVAGRDRETPVKSSKTLGGLSSRQREIACLVGGGDSNREIANRLSITEKTVKAYLTAIFQRLGLSSRVQLALFVAESAGRATRSGARELRPERTRASSALATR